MTQQTALTPEEVAEALKIAKNTVYELIKRGELRAYKVSNKVRVDQNDLDDYIMKSKSLNSKVVQSTPLDGSNTTDFSGATASPPANQIILCGQDSSLDILASTIQNHPNGTPILRSYVGSYAGLMSLYHDTCQITACHLWDGDTNSYNTAYVKHLVPGIPCIIIRIATRIQGFYVAKGNPKNILGWSDLTRKDITLVNREKGSGTRVLLDEHLRLLSMDNRKIQGYLNEESSHLSIASAISRNIADVGLGCEKVALGIGSIDFIPLQKECYDVVIKKSSLNQPIFQLIYEVINSEAFKNELIGLGGYDLSEIGIIVDET